MWLPASSRERPQLPWQPASWKLPYRQVCEEAETKGMQRVLGEPVGQSATLQAVLEQTLSQSPQTHLLTQLFSIQLPLY